MSANDDYPWKLMGQNYQKMCDEIDRLRILSNHLKQWKDDALIILRRWDEVADLVPEAPEHLGHHKSYIVSNYIDHLRDLDDAAGKEIEDLKRYIEMLESEPPHSPEGD